jgi:hypothetical protein
MEAAIVRGRSSSWEVESGIALLFSESVAGGLGDEDDILYFVVLKVRLGEKKSGARKVLSFGNLTVH